MNSLTVYNAQTHLAHSQPAKALLELGRENGWAFAILGIAPLPTEVVKLAKWEIVPAHLDTSSIPARALERIQAVYAAGFRPKGFVIAHELPMEVIDEPAITIERDVTIDVGKVVEVTGKALGAIALGAAAVLGLAGSAALAVGSALLLDPILVAVTDDDVWVEIDRWYD